MFKRRRFNFQPNVLSLEGRHLLSLTLMSGAGDIATAWAPPRTTQFLGQVSSSTTDQLSATVDWGDGTTPSVYQNATANQYYRYPMSVYVPGHTFQKSGNLTIHVTVQDQHGSSLSWDDHFTVNDAPVNFSQEEGIPVGVAYNEVGAKFRLDTQLVSNDPTAVLDKVTYTFTEPDGSAGGVLVVSTDANGNPLPVFDRTGFHEEEVRSDFGTKDGPTHAHFEGYWDGHPGDHLVDAYVTWHNSKGIPFGVQLKTADYFITSPVASVQTTFGNSSYQFIFDPRLVDNPGWFLTSYKPTQQGITIDATLDGATDAGGTYGIVQVVKPTSYYWDLSGAKYQAYVSVDPQGKTPTDWPLLDNDPGNPDNPYYDIVAAGQYQTSWDASAALHLVDAPRVQISTLDSKIQENDSFQDFVMFTPTGGIPVPVMMQVNGSDDIQYSFGWYWGGTMTWDATGDSPNPSALLDPSLSWMSYAAPTTPSWGNTAWFYQQTMPNGIQVA